MYYNLTHNHRTYTLETRWQCIIEATGSEEILDLSS